MSDKSWMGGKSYSELLNLDYSSLDRKRCYTVGFRHHDFHPLLADPGKTWNVQSVNDETFEVSYKIDIPGINFIEPLEKTEDLSNALELAKKDWTF